MTQAQVEALPEAEAQQVLEAWVKARRTELPAALVSSTSKPHAKLAKKALYRLQSAGVEVAAPKPASTEPTPASPQPARNEFPAVLSEQLGTGERAIFFAVPIRGGGLELFQGVVSDEFGLCQFSSIKSNRKVYRERLRALESDPDSRVMLVPWERLQLELGRAMTLNARTKTEYGEEVENTLARLGITPADPDFPIPPLEEQDEANSADGEKLHDTRELGQWLPSEQHLAALAQRVDAARSPALGLSEAEQAARTVAEARALAAEVFTPSVRLLYARRLWYAAELFDATQRPALAQAARAEARRLAHSSAPSRFAEVLFEKAIAAPAPTRAPAGALSLPRR